MAIKIWETTIFPFFVVKCCPSSTSCTWYYTWFSSWNPEFIETRKPLRSPWVDKIPLKPRKKTRAGPYQNKGMDSMWRYPQIIHFNWVFHYFHHPFLGTSIFGNIHVINPILIVPLSPREKNHGIFLLQKVLREKRLFLEKYNSSGLCLNPVFFKNHHFGYRC